MSVPPQGEPRAGVPRAIRLGVWSGYLNLGVTWAIQLVMVPLLLGHLGGETYGLYAALTSVVGYFSLLTFGSSLTVPRYVADHAARGEGEALSRFVSTYLMLYLAVALAGLAAGFAAAPLVRALIRVPAGLAAEVAPAWRLVVGGWALGLAAGLLQSLLTGLGEVHLANLAASARTVLNLAFAATVLWLGGRLDALLEGFLVAALVSGAGLYVAVRLAHPEIRITPALAGWDVLRRSGRPAAYYFLMQIAALVVMGTDNIVISAFLGVGSVAAYAVAFQLYALAVAALWSGVDVLLPFFARWGAQQESDRLRGAYLGSTKYAMAGTVLAAILLAAYGRAVIGWWVGPSLFVGERVLLVFCTMLLIATPIHGAALVLAGLGRHRAPAIGGAVEAALNLALSILLVRTLGVLGVALGTLLAGAATNGWVAPAAACRELGIRVGAYLRATLVPSLLPAAVGGAIAWLAPGRSAAGLGAAAAGIALTAAGFIATFWTLGLASDERRHLRSLVRR
ncbi:MAG TPA: oligosaccharide flippase family protein [Gemmatimonadales bacterium]|nr:oligosaccharide flippase family protein [Gemmatimonadales bacterium]